MHSIRAPFPSTIPASIMPPLELVVFLGDEIMRYPLPASGRVTLGRAPECDICIQDASISRQHAAVHLGPPLRVEDLGSANGTQVRRHGALDADTYQMRRSPGETFAIAPGDRIVLGSVAAVIRLAPVGEIGPRGDEGFSPGMAALYEQARLVAQGTISVLILGETGAGKEVLGRAIHKSSARAGGPFIALHCA